LNSRCKKVRVKEEKKNPEASCMLWFFLELAYSAEPKVSGFPFMNVMKFQRGKNLELLTPKRQLSIE